MYGLRVLASFGNVRATVDHALIFMLNAHVVGLGTANDANYLLSVDAAKFPNGVHSDSFSVVPRRAGARGLSKLCGEVFGLLPGFKRPPKNGKRNAVRHAVEIVRIFGGDLPATVVQLVDFHGGLQSVNSFVQRDASVYACHTAVKHQSSRV